MHEKIKKRAEKYAHRVADIAFYDDWTSIELAETAYIEGYKAKLSQIDELVHLIECNPADVKLLKKEYEQLTGKKYRRKK